MQVLDTISSPADLRRLDRGQLAQLAQEVRDFLVETVCRTGGHLGPNLGIVEVTLAVHRVFDSPHDPIVFDTGHQAYVHKVVTGRASGFHRLRSRSGLSGYPSRAESVHDVVENSHASTALSYAHGLSTSFDATGQSSRHVVAVVGDGALTGGMAWEALNNLGRAGRRVVVVLNDNGRSYAPTAGALPRHLERIADRSGYADVHAVVSGGPGRAGTPPRGSRAEGGLFQSLGFTYLGPVDGHDLDALEAALRDARGVAGPVVVHCLTRKGHGYPPAERDEADRFHTVGVVDPSTGRAPTTAVTWTDAFAEALVALGTERRDVVGVSAAMLGPTGLQRFADRFPGRCHDVGIAEQHALTSAAGMALGGLHPVVAIYATFLNRAFDQTLMDLGMHRLPVTLVLDRAGITGPDGPSHHGMWDLTMLSMVPGMRVAAPRDVATLVEELREAVETDGPTAIRFPKALVGQALPAVRREGRVDVLRDGEDLLVLAVGVMAGPALAAADQLEKEGISCTVVDPGWVVPVDPCVVELARAARCVVTVEDGLRVGGVGSHVASALADGGVMAPVRCLGLPGAFVPHGSRSELLAAHGLDATGVAAGLRAAWGATPSLSVLRPPAPRASRSAG